MPPHTTRTTRKVISLNIDLVTYTDALSEIVAMAVKKCSGYVCFANVHMTIEGYEHASFAEMVNRATLVLADGVPIVKSLQILYKTSVQRVAGMDAFPDLLKLAETNGLKVFFFGSTPEVLEKIKIKTEIEFPSLKIAGLLSPPFDKSLDDVSYVNVINASDASLVFVALGCPKQEKWMAVHSSEINAVLLGVGGAFPVYAGIAKRAPLLMQNFGLEWLYRLAQEPTRLFKRYFKTNTLFIFLLIKEKLKMTN